MAKYRLKPGATIGALAAENDRILQKAFIDSGLLSLLTDCSDPRCFILGRTGSGKTALLRRLKETNDHVSILDPEELSMQFLHNSSLRTIRSWGVNLEPFYKYLWKHICILELIRLRYANETDIPTSFLSRFDLSKIKKREDEARKVSKQYLATYGDQYWVKSDTRIKKITEELNSRLTADAAISLTLQAPFGSIQAGQDSAAENESKVAVEREVLDRTQKVVSEFLIADLNKVLDLLSEYGFRDSQKQFYILVDDLDKEWMPDEVLYLELVKSLLSTVADLNRRIPALKIVISLRENTFFRLFRKASQMEPQREKWKDLILHLRWLPQDLTGLVNQRLSEIFREQYTSKAPTLLDILPERTKHSQDPVEFILERTFLRPRDMIEFINIYIEKSGSLSRDNWSLLYESEIEYSKSRLQSVFDEWRDTYFGITALFGFLKSRSTEFKMSDFSGEDINTVLSSHQANECTWLKRLSSNFITSSICADDLTLSFFRALFHMGIIGIKTPGNVFRYSYDNPISTAMTENINYETVFRVHKAFWSALGIGDPRRGKL
ncbi:MAG TPA: hypothetical protein DCS07_12385 [Bdellovibrionales bacterium]|nr:MAG: hypothetical protein A2X97_02250 [Bdellovibrionales bacterium GWA1_52_35]HAR43407.1 hypothetical protein [Bdellovibrionales bacterium]HCM39237.1 hypothetical protein [Bdellovibrionales bacterium]